MDYNRISDIGNRRVHNVTIISNSELSQTAMMSVNLRNTPDIYIYNSRTDTVRTGSADDIAPVLEMSGSKPARLFAHITYSKVRGIVIVE